MLPMQPDPGSISDMCWRPVCRALQHPAMSLRISLRGNGFTPDFRAAMSSMNSSSH